MTMAWVAVGAAVIGAGAAYAGSKKQADAAKKAAQISQDQFATTNSQQQPYIQSGYGALQQLNHLMGIGGPISSAPPAAAPPTNAPAPQLAQQEQPQSPDQATPPPPDRSLANSARSPQLRQLLAVRAKNGDAQASQFMRMMQ